MALNDKQRERLDELGIADPDRMLTTEDLAPGEQILFSSTGVTDGELLTGVRFFGGGCRTHTLFMSCSRRLIRFVDTHPPRRRLTPVFF